MKHTAFILFVITLSYANTIGRGEGICGAAKSFLAKSTQQKSAQLRTCMEKSPDFKNKHLNMDDVSVGAANFFDSWKSKCNGADSKIIRRRLSASPTLDSFGYDCIDG